MTDLDVAALRRQIPTTQRLTYLNTGWAGPSPTSVVEAVRARLEYESHGGRTSTEVVDSGKAIRRQAKEAVASLLKASADEVLLTENTTEGINVVLNGLRWESHDEVITCDLEHGSILLPLYHLRELYGVTPRVLKLRPDAPHDEIVSKVEEAVTDRTRMIFMSHIEYSCGLRMPIEAIGRLARQREILTLVDGAQAAGHIPIDVREVGCDFYSIPGQKWLLGPDETGALFIRESMIGELEPMRIGLGWVNEKQFDSSGWYVPEPGIDRFVASTTSAPLRAGFLEAVRFVQEVGIEQIEQRNLSLAARLKRELAATDGVSVLSPTDGPGCSGLVTFTVAGVEPETAVAELWARDNILVRDVSFPAAIRASTHFFNTEEEVMRLADAVRALATSPPLENGD